MAKMQELVARYSSFAQVPSQTGRTSSKKTVVCLLHLGLSLTSTESSFLLRSLLVRQAHWALIFWTNCSHNQTLKLSSVLFEHAAMKMRRSELRRACEYDVSGRTAKVEARWWHTLRISPWPICTSLRRRLRIIDTD